MRVGDSGRRAAAATTAGAPPRQCAATAGADRFRATSGEEEREAAPAPGLPARGLACLVPAASGEKEREGKGRAETEEGEAASAGCGR